MRSHGQLFLPQEVTLDLRAVADLSEGTVAWGWRVSDLLTSEVLWLCSHPVSDLLPSGRWLARSLLEGSDIVRSLLAGDPFPPACHPPFSDEAGGAG